MAYADLADVRIVDRNLGPDDEVLAYVDVLLSWAEAHIRAIFPDLDQRVVDGRTDPVLLVQVEAEMVAAVTRNPNAYASESEGIGSLSGSHTFNLEAASGLLRFTDKQQAMVAGAEAAAGSSGGAFTIRPGARAAHY